MNSQRAFEESLATRIMRGSTTPRQQAERMARTIAERDDAITEIARHWVEGTGWPDEPRVAGWSAAELAERFGDAQVLPALVRLQRRPDAVERMTPEDDILLADPTGRRPGGRAALAVGGLEAPVRPQTSRLDVERTTSARREVEHHHHGYQQGWTRLALGRHGATFAPVLAIIGLSAIAVVASSGDTAVAVAAVVALAVVALSSVMLGTSPSDAPAPRSRRR